MSLIKIKDVYLPALLIDLIKQGIWQTYTTQKIRKVAPFLIEPMEFLQSIEEIKNVSENPILLQENIFGIQSSRLLESNIEFPLLDYDKSIYIAINKYPGDDIGIALDFRKNSTEPCVVASDFNGHHPHCEWRVISQNLADFIQNIS